MKILGATVLLALFGTSTAACVNVAVLAEIPDDARVEGDDSDRHDEDVVEERDPFRDDDVVEFHDGEHHEDAPERQ